MTSAGLNSSPMRRWRAHGAARRCKKESETMFIAMNRLKVVKGSEHDFEQVWFNRKSTLSQMPGFVVFHLVKGPERDDHVLYASHTVWRSRADFEAWTKSEQFRTAHQKAGGKPRFTLIDNPEFEGFTVLQEVTPDGARLVAAA
jgi:heme-degrading monooxygenase HmoA